MASSPQFRPPAFRPVAGAALVLLGTTLSASDDWRAGGENHGIDLEYRSMPSGFRAYRGSTTVCTSLSGLQRFVADASRLAEWIPYTEEARELSSGDSGETLYYLRTDAPWPFKSRDMVYQLVPEPADGSGSIHIDLEGLPDAVPERANVVRLRSADGRWALTPTPHGIDVALRLAVDSGPVPAFFADRRLAATVAGTLANLAAAFPCHPDDADLP